MKPVQLYRRNRCQSPEKKGLVYCSATAAAGSGGGCTHLFISQSQVVAKQTGRGSDCRDNPKYTKSRSTRLRMNPGDGIAFVIRELRQ